MSYALITGSISKEPETKLSKANREYICATVRVRDGKNMQSWRVMAFSDTAIAEIRRLKVGDALSARGQMEVETFTGNDGQTRVSFSLMADAILPLRPPPRKTDEPAAEPAARHRMDRHSGNGADEFGDRVPF